MKQCLACWEEIDDIEEECHHCGSNQEEVKDYLALVLLKQGKKKIEVPRDTPVLDYVFDVDPTTKEEITVSIKSSSEPEPEKPLMAPLKPGVQADGTYVPGRPGWLSRPANVVDKETVTDSKQDSTDPKVKQSVDKRKTVSCPQCFEDVPLLKYCKFCGQILLRNCPSCNNEIPVIAKFCKVCGTKVDPLLEKKSDD